MRKLPATLLAVAGLALAAGVAQAAERMRTMEVALPDGSVAQIEYAGKVAPRVEVLPAEARVPADTGAIAYDPFAEMDRISAMMEARHAQMMRQVAEMQQRVHAAAAEGKAAPGQVVVTGNLPAGTSYSYTMVSTSSGANGCTQTVEYSSDGSSAEPKITRTSSGDCSAVEKNPAPVEAPAPARPEEPAVPAATRVVGQSNQPSNET